MNRRRQAVGKFYGLLALTAAIWGIQPLFIKLADGRESPAHQLLYFTCQPHMVDVLRAAAPGAPLFKVESGGITAG